MTTNDRITPAPLSAERLAEIRDSIPLEYAAPWQTHHEMVNDSWMVRYATDNPLAGLVAMVPDYGFYLAEFIATARTAVPELLAEVARLQARVAELEEDSALLGALYAAGVDNWEGYDDAVAEAGDR